MVSIAAVVPCFPPHLFFARRLALELARADDPPDEIVIAASGLVTPAARWLQRSVCAPDTMVPVRVTAVADRQTAGQNRNRGADLTTCDYVMFLDADDTYHPSRMRIIRTLADRFWPTLILHSYARRPEALPASLCLDDRLLVHNDEIFRGTFGVPPARDRGAEKGVHGDTNLEFDRDVHFGVPAVRHDVFRTVRYTDMPRGEDGRFCRDVCWVLGGVLFVDLPLVLYTAWHERSTIQRLLRWLL